MKRIQAFALRILSCLCCLLSLSTASWMVSDAPRALAKGSSSAGSSSATVKPSGAKKSQSSKQIEAWEIKQASKVVGPISCLIAPEAVRLRAEKLGITWIFKAPKWEAYLYNTETKNFCSFPYEVWKDRGFFMPGGRGSKAKSDLHEMKMIKSGNTRDIAGQKAYELVIKKGDGTRYGELWIASNITAPKQFSEVVSGMVMLPLKGSGAPVQASVFQAKVNKIVPVLNTESARKTMVDAQVFEPLSGYNRVKDEMALMFEDNPDSLTANGLFGGSRDKDVLLRKARPASSATISPVSPHK